MPCYSCIQNDYIFCVYGQQHQIISPMTWAPFGVCCKSYDTCDYVTDPAWNYSSSYNDKLLSMRVCPFKQSGCGTTDQFTFTKVGA